MLMNASCQEDPRYTVLERVLAYLDKHVEEQPTLEELAGIAGMSAFHFQRTFTRWVGVSPKQYLQQLSLEQAKQLLREGRSVLDTALESGLSGPGRLHDLFVSFDAVTPGQFKTGGQGLEILWGLAPSPFGPAFIAHCDRGIVALEFPRRPDTEKPLALLKARWPGSRICESPRETLDLARRIFADDVPERPLHLHLRGTNFRIKVWQALLHIPPAHLISYGELARGVGTPRGSRAVGQAVGANPIAWLIPCHRVIQASGKLGNYHWGLARKRAMINWEQAQRAGGPDRELEFAPAN